ncbi:PAS domain S-box protein [Pseudodesulfovibrio cashew]|nr:PAS domain S-box protein [Pseudodesulfovibrio cashew]
MAKKSDHELGKSGPPGTGEDGDVASGLFDHVPMPYQSLDAEGRLRDVNQAWLEMLGYPRDTVAGTPFETLLTTQSLGLFREAFPLLLAGEEVTGLELILIHRLGSRVLVSLDIRVSPGPEGEFSLAHCVLCDITEQRRSEKRLAASEQRFRGLFETSIDGIIYIDAEATILDVNPAFCKMLGMTRDGLLGKNGRDVIVPGGAEEVRELHKRELRGERFDGDIRLELVHANGHRIPVSIRFWSVPGITSSIKGTWVMVKDISRTIKAEEALLRSESQYRRIVETANEGIIGLDASLRIVFANQVLANFLDFERHELLGRPVRDVLPPEESEGLLRRLAMREADAETRYECPFVRKDGARVWGLVSASRLLSESGESTGSFAMIADITKRKQAEGALRRSSDLLNEVQRISRTGGWDVDMVNGEVYWTNEQCRLHGVKPGLNPGSVDRIVSTYVHPDDQESVHRHWRVVLEEKIPDEVEYRVVKRDGSKAVFHKKSIPDLDAQGNVYRVYGSTRDVTLERQAALELEESHRRMLTILDGMDADICVSDVDGYDILFINKHMREKFGTPLSGEKCFSRFRRNPIPCSNCPKTRLLDDDGVPVETLIRESFNRVTQRWTLNHDRAIEWLEGKLVHMHMAADITALKEMEEELKHAMCEAEAANVAKNEFLANMSHEIRTPLNGLLGMLQILQFSDLDEEQRESLGTAVNSGRNLLQILNDILDLSKIESGMMEFEEEAMELGELLESVNSVFRHLAGLRGVDLQWCLDDSRPCHFLADKGRLRQILFNLVGNAIKFTESGSVVVEAYPLEATFEDGLQRVLFIVTDTGIGIPEDKIERVFDPFTQVDGSSSRRYQGTGLGLSIVRRLVTLMGGSISVSSMVNEGTSVAFTVLLRSSDAPLPRHLEKAGAGDFRSGLSILVAEDEYVNRLVARRLLHRLGHTATCVEDGEKAVELLRSHTFDCVLTDIQMPGMDGLETTRVIREELGLNIPVVALTAHAMKGDRTRFLEAGMNGYIAKPFEMHDLEDELRRVLENGRGGAQ